MALRALLVVVMPLAALAAVASCGGAVVKDGSGGSGATSTTDLPDTTTGPTTTPTGTTTGTSGGGIEEACEKACEKLLQCEDEPKCVDGCLDDQPGPECSEEYLVFVGCIADHYDVGQCDLPAECLQALDAVESCDGGGGSSSSSGGTGDCAVGCSGGPGGGCECDASCSGANYKVSCGSDGQGLACSCFQNGVGVGKCSGGWGGEPCDPFQGCCAGYFFGE